MRSLLFVISTMILAALASPNALVVTDNTIYVTSNNALYTFNYDLTLINKFRAQSQQYEFTFPASISGNTLFFSDDNRDGQYQVDVNTHAISYDASVPKMVVYPSTGWVDDTPRPDYTDSKGNKITVTNSGITKTAPNGTIYSFNFDYNSPRTLGRVELYNDLLYFTASYQFGGLMTLFTFDPSIMQVTDNSGQLPNSGLNMYQNNVFADGLKQLIINNGVVIWTYAVRQTSDPNDYDVYYAVHVYSKARGVLTYSLQDETLAPSAQFDDQSRVYVNFDGDNYYIDLKTWTYTSSITGAWNLQANTLSDGKFFTYGGWQYMVYTNQGDIARYYGANQDGSQFTFTKDLPKKYTTYRIVMAQNDSLYLVLGLATSAGYDYFEINRYTGVIIDGPITLAGSYVSDPSAYNGIEPVNVNAGLVAWVTTNKDGSVKAVVNTYSKACGTGTVVIDENNLSNPTITKDSCASAGTGNSATPSTNNGAATSNNGGAATPSTNDGAATPSSNNNGAATSNNGGAATSSTNNGAATPSTDNGAATSNNNGVTPSQSSNNGAAAPTSNQGNNGVATSSNNGGASPSQNIPVTTSDGSDNGNNNGDSPVGRDQSSSAITIGFSAVVILSSILLLL